MFVCLRSDPRGVWSRVYSPRSLREFIPLAAFGRSFYVCLRSDPRSLRSRVYSPRFGRSFIPLARIARSHYVCLCLSSLGKTLARIAREFIPLNAALALCLFVYVCPRFTRTLARIAREFRSMFVCLRSDPRGVWSRVYSPRSLREFIPLVSRSFVSFVDPLRFLGSLGYVFLRRPSLAALASLFPSLDSSRVYSPQRWEKTRVSMSCSDPRFLRSMFVCLRSDPRGVWSRVYSPRSLRSLVLCLSSLGPSLGFCARSFVLASLGPSVWSLGYVFLRRPSLAALASLFPSTLRSRVYSPLRVAKSRPGWCVVPTCRIVPHRPKVLAIRLRWRSEAPKKRTSRRRHIVGPSRIGEAYRRPFAL